MSVDLKQAASDAVERPQLGVCAETSPEKPRPLAPRRRGSQHYDAILWRLQTLDVAPASPALVVGFLPHQAAPETTAVAVNVAVRAADHGCGPVVLVDLDPDMAPLEAALRPDAGPGLADVFLGDCPVDRAVRATSIDGLSLVNLGRKELLDRAPFDQHRVDDALAELAESHPVVVLSLPDASRMRHATLFAKRADALLLVLRTGASRRGDVLKLLEGLRAGGVQVVGSVLTHPG